MYFPKVTMNAGEVIFDDFTVGTSKGFIGNGPGGAAELVGPLKKNPTIYPISRRQDGHY
jgi:filamentous hemagglutinin